MNDSYTILQNKLAFEITSRYIAAYIQIAGLNCSYFIGQGVMDPTKLSNICTKYPFNGLTNIQNLYQPLFFNDLAARQYLLSETKMTDAELNAIYNASMPTSFGAQAANQS